MHSRDVYSLHNSSGIDVRAYGQDAPQGRRSRPAPVAPLDRVMGMGGSATLPEPPASLLERRCGAGRVMTRKNPQTPPDGLACRSWRYAKDRRSALPITLIEGGHWKGHRETW